MTTRTLPRRRTLHDSLLLLKRFRETLELVQRYPLKEKKFTRKAKLAKRRYL